MVYSAISATFCPYLSLKSVNYLLASSLPLISWLEGAMMEESQSYFSSLSDLFQFSRNFIFSSKKEMRFFCISVWFSKVLQVFLRTSICRSFISTFLSVSASSPSKRFICACSSSLPYRGMMSEMSFILSMFSICSDSVMEGLMRGLWPSSLVKSCLYIVILITKSYYRPTLIIAHRTSLYHHSCWGIFISAQRKGISFIRPPPCHAPMIIERQCKLYQLNRMAEQFAAAPKVVKPKNKYKEQPQEQQEDEIKLIYNNLMWDKRIFRGNTYSAIVISKKNDNNYDQQPKIPVRTIRQPQETASAFESSKRANIEIFTDQFVESLTDKPPRYEYASQTDPLPDRPVIRHRIADKIGQDIETQIWDNQLFDFDYEVEPLLNVLCGRTLEVSRMEVLQEEELKIMSNRQQELRLYQREENKKIQNMYDQEDKLQQENLKNIQNFKKEKEKKVKTHKKVFARVVAKQFLRDIKSNTLSYVEGNGFFRNTIDTRLVSQVLPKFYAETAAIANEDIYYHNEANKILDDARQSIVKEHAWAKQVERTRRNQIIAKRDEVAREKKERKGMEAEERRMRQFLAEEKVFLEQEEQRKREEEAKEEVAVEQS